MIFEGSGGIDIESLKCRFSVQKPAPPVFWEHNSKNKIVRAFFQPQCYQLTEIFYLWQRKFTKLERKSQLKPSSFLQTECSSTRWSGAAALRCTRKPPRTSSPPAGLRSPAPMWTRGQQLQGTGATWWLTRAVQCFDCEGWRRFGGTVEVRGEGRVDADQGVNSLQANSLLPKMSSSEKGERLRAFTKSSKSRTSKQESLPDSIATRTKHVQKKMPAF